MWEKCKAFILVDKHQKMVSFYFRAALLSLIVLNLIYLAFQLIPDDIMFFFTSSGMELFVSGISGYVICFKLIPLKKLYKKTIGFIILFIIILGLSLLKVYRRNSEVIELYDNTLEYVGAIVIFTSLFYFFDHLNLFLNNGYVKTQKALEEANQKLLLQQLNPHFLFNAFNSLYSLSLKNSSATPETILKLSGMMRYMTDEVQITFIPLSKELKFINDYVAIEKIRFGNEANIKYDFENETKDILIPPMLLITLVENAFKHGFYINDSNAFVYIKCTTNNSILNFVVENSIQEKQFYNQQTREGVGLGNLRQRLDYYFKNNYNLELSKDENVYKALLKIKFNNE